MNHIEAHLLCNPSPLIEAATRGMLQCPQNVSSEENGRRQTRQCAARSYESLASLRLEVLAAASLPDVRAGGLSLSRSRRSLCGRRVDSVAESLRPSTSARRFAINRQVRTSHSWIALASPQRTSISPVVWSNS